MKETKKQVTKHERREQDIAEAMNDVRGIVKTHGLSIVRACVNRLHELDKQEQQVNKLRAEADELSKKIRDEADALEEKLKVKKLRSA